MGQFPTLYVESRSLTLSETLRQAGQMDAADRIERDREVILALMEALDHLDRCARAPTLATLLGQLSPEYLSKSEAALRLAQQAGHGEERR